MKGTRNAVEEKGSFSILQNKKNLMEMERAQTNHGIGGDPVGATGTL